MKKRLVIQEHDAVQAGLHWDLRLEKEFTDNTVIEKKRFSWDCFVDGIEELIQD